MTPESDVQNILTLLRRAIRSSGHSQKEVDRRIGVQPGYLSQVMIGRLDLKLKHLLRALEAIEVEPAAFFELVFGLPGEANPTSSDLLSLVSPAAVGGHKETAAPGVVSTEDLEQLIARTVREEIRHRLPPTQPGAGKR